MSDDAKQTDTILIKSPLNVYLVKPDELRREQLALKAIGEHRLKKLEDYDF
jgi:hypothetical protein